MTTKIKAAIIAAVVIAAVAAFLLLSPSQKPASRQSVGAEVEKATEDLKSARERYTFVIDSLKPYRGSHNLSAYELHKADSLVYDKSALSMLSDCRKSIHVLNARRDSLLAVYKSLPPTRELPPK